MHRLTALGPRVSETMLMSGVVLTCFQTMLVAALIAELFFGVSPLGSGHHDFLAYYSASHLVRADHPQLIYDAAAISSFQHYTIGQTAGALGYMPFLNPPFVAAALEPLSSVSLDVSRLLWFFGNVSLAVGVVMKMTWSLPIRRRLGWSALLVSNFPMYQSLAEGQLSIFLLAGCYLALLSLKRNQQLSGGLALSILWVKPQLALAVLVGLLFCQCWRAAATMVATLLGVTLASVTELGFATYRIYPSFLSSTLHDHLITGGLAQTWSGDLSRTEGLNGFLIGWFGDARISTVFAGCVGVVACAALAYASHLVRPGLGSIASKLMIIAAVNVALLIDPHLYPQDLVIYLVAIPLLPVRYLSFPMVVGSCCLLDFSAIDILFPIHLFTLFVLTATAVILWLVVVRGEGLRLSWERDRLA
jgi:hypothetical protein